MTSKAELAERDRGILHLSRLLEKEWVIISLLVAWGLFVYYHQLGYPLKGEEAHYAAIARRIVRTGEWLRFEYEGHPYLNKPPLHFWMIALSFLAWGPTEFAVRFPSATFGVGTMLLVYYCGKVLYHRRIGLVAALITTTTFATVWNARRAKFDTELGFWMNLALFAFYMAYRSGGRRFGYLCLAFVAMATGTMVKGPVAVLLPGVTALALLVITRRSKATREIPFLLAGLGIFLLITGPYYHSLGGAFNRNFFVGENLTRIWGGGGPAFYYFYAVFTEFFPWSLLLPSAGLYLWKSRSRSLGEGELLLLVWMAGFFLLLSLPAFKGARFLTYLIPPFALLLARYSEHLFSESERLQPVENRLLRITATVLALTTFVALFVGPRLVQMRYRIPADFVPVPFVLLIGVGCVAVAYTALRKRPQGIFVGMMAVALVMTFGLVQFFYPALGRYASAIPISLQVREKVRDSPLIISDPTRGFTYEIVYYLDRPYPVPLLQTADEIHAAFRAERPLFGLLTKERYEELELRGDLPLLRVADYSYRKMDMVLVANRDRL